jgi:hypothetical protein
MQATSSPIATTVSNAIANTAFLADLHGEAPQGFIPLSLRQSADASKRSHVLVRRRKRATRRAIR